MWVDNDIVAVFNEYVAVGTLMSGSPHPSRITMYMGPRGKIAFADKAKVVFDVGVDAVYALDAERHMAKRPYVNMAVVSDTQLVVGSVRVGLHRTRSGTCAVKLESLFDDRSDLPRMTVVPLQCDHATAYVWDSLRAVVGDRLRAVAREYEHLAFDADDRVPYAFPNDVVRRLTGDQLAVDVVGNFVPHPSLRAYTPSPTVYSGICGRGCSVS